MSALEQMNLYYDEMCACNSTDKRTKVFKKMLALWQESEIVRTIWDYCEKAHRLIDRFMTKVKRAMFKPMRNVVFSCNRVEADELAYALRLLDENGNLIWSKVGTTVRSMEERLREHLRDYKKDGVVTIEVTRVWDCGTIKAEGVESMLRAEYIRKYPGTFQKNDRFAGVEFDLTEADALVNKYLTE